MQFGIGLLLLLIAFKVLGYIQISWWIVILSPIWGNLLLFIVVIAFTFLSGLLIVFGAFGWELARQKLEAFKRWNKGL